MTQKTSVQEIIEMLNLESHPEGGYFKETYRSVEAVNRKDGESRSAGTGIYFLLPANVCTNWHRVNSDELWHFYKGDKLLLEIIDTEGNFEQLQLGADLSNESLQELVPKNSWQRAYSTGDYSLVGCTVAPGFEFDDFEMIEQQKLADQYPRIASKVMRDPF